MLLGRTSYLATVVIAVVAITVLVGNQASGVADRRFECALWGNCMPPSSPPYTYFQQAQFDALNWDSANGHFLAVLNDNHKDEINGNGNFQAIWYDGFNAGYGTYSGAAWADCIEDDCSDNFPDGIPSWIILNEISAGSWPSDNTYRLWVHNVVHKLKNTYGHSVILCSPFQNPANNGSDWQAVSADAFIGDECYLSGAEVNASGNSVNWCQTQYQNSKDDYTDLGVSSSKMVLVEHYAQTSSGKGYGRADVSYAGWDNAINARSTGAHNVGFYGHVSYYWKGNDMCTSSDDLVHFINTYAAKTLP